MLELLTNAWQGWQRYTDGGKYGALLALVLLFLWFRRDEEKEKILLVYTTLAAALCVFPVSAAVLMAHQTRFYDYEWIWSYVPVTLIIAYGGTVFLIGSWKCYQKSIWKCMGITMAVLGLTVLCGSMGAVTYKDAVEDSDESQVQAALAVLTSESEGQEICLWGPRDFMASVRAYDGNIRLLYGRDMWDASLRGYSYDIYGEVEERLYRWMYNLEETGTSAYTLATDNAAGGSNASGTESAVLGAETAATDAEIVIDGAWCIEAAKAAGVNRILLPGTIAADALGQLAEAAGTEAVPCGAYYLLKVG